MEAEQLFSAFTADKIKGNESKLHHFYLKKIAACITKVHMQCLEKLLRICNQSGKILISPELFFSSSLLHFFSPAMAYQPQDHSSSKTQSPSMAFLYLISGQVLPILPEEQHSHFTTTILTQDRIPSPPGYFKRLLNGLQQLRLSTPPSHPFCVL